ncbi:MAG: formate dehydrogenase accessory sulfurtransferase FdhD [Methanomassiliicoccales archaeon]
MREIKEYGYTRVTREGFRESIEPVAVEESFRILMDGEPVSTVMASPNSLEELGAGHLLSEGRLGDRRIERVIVRAHGIDVRTASDGPRGETGEIVLTPEMIFNLLPHLENEVYRRTSGTHSASVLDPEGRPVAGAADVRRHSAYDKAIGGALLAGQDLGRSIMLASGRQSGELVGKAARAGIPVTVSKAAPISSGIEAARSAGMTLICFLDERKFSVFHGRERIRL